MIKLAHTHWKLRKYTALAKTKAAQKEEAIQRAPSAARRKKDNEVPFGVRAIESGIEVDGVWISRSNTPANSTPGSPALSANKGSAAQAPAAAQAYASPDRASTASNMSRLEIPQAAHGHPRLGPRSSTSTHTRGSSNPFERSVSSEQLPSRPASSYTEFAPRSRPSYQPRRASALRYSTIDTSAEALASLEGKILASKTGSKSSQGRQLPLKVPALLCLRQSRLSACLFVKQRLMCIQSPPNTSLPPSVVLMIRGLGHPERPTVHTPVTHRMLFFNLSLSRLLPPATMTRIWILLQTTANLMRRRQVNFSHGSV